MADRHEAEVSVEKRPTVLCDIDGTVAIHDGIRHHYDYDNVHLDLPNQPIIDLVRHISSKYDIIFVSGREDSCFDATVAWLDKYVTFDSEDVTWEVIGDDPWLFMRTTGDYRPDYIIKAELYDAHIRDKYDVAFVLDDRDQVVNMWRGLGLVALQVADGSF